MTSKEDQIQQIIATAVNSAVAVDLLNPINLEYVAKELEELICHTMNQVIDVLSQDEKPPKTVPTEPKVKQPTSAGKKKRKAKQQPANEPQ